MEECMPLPLPEPERMAAVLADSGVETGNDSDSASCESSFRFSLPSASPSPSPWPLPPLPLPAKYDSDAFVGKSRPMETETARRSRSLRFNPYSQIPEPSRTRCRSSGSKLNERLRTAAGTNNAEGVAEALAEGADPRGADRHGRTALHLASCRGYAEIVRLLIAAGANPDARDCRGNSPLHLAACTSHVSVIIELLDGGADVSGKDGCGRSPLQLAQSKLRMIRWHGSRSLGGEDAERVRGEIARIVDVMRKVMEIENADLAEIEDVRRHLETARTEDQIEDQVRRLLRGLDGLNLAS